jgi:putative transposase
MARHIRKQFPGAKYHVTNRGNGRQEIFTESGDCGRFVEQLAEAVERDKVILYAYCLMPNHFHLFVETPNGNLDRFMGRLTTAYAMYWRYRRRKPGHCFQNRYKAALVEGDGYALALTRYIHLNPIKTKAASGLSAIEMWKVVATYQWSSARGYLDAKCTGELVDYRWLDVLGNGSRDAGCREYERYLKAFLAQDDEDFLKVMSKGQYAIGDEDFQQETTEWAIAQGRRRKRPADAIVPQREPVRMSTIERAVAREFNVKTGLLKCKSVRLGLARWFFVELACTFGALTQRAVADYVGGVTEHAIGKTRQRLHLRLATDEKARKRWENLTGIMSIV